MACLGWEMLYAKSKSTFVALTSLASLLFVLLTSFCTVQAKPLVVVLGLGDTTGKNIYGIETQHKTY